MNLTDDQAREIYQRFHSSELTQADLAKRIGISFSSMNQIVKAIRRFAFLQNEFPDMTRRSTERVRVKAEPKPRTRKKAAPKAKPVSAPKPAPVPVAAAVEGEDDPAIDLAAQALDTFYGLCPSIAVLISKFAGPETRELLELADRKPCGRLLRHLPHLKGRPKTVKNSTLDEEKIRHDEETELDRERAASDYVLQEAGK
jgi:transcriptional regulator with XRE-family HTH domain